MTEVYRNVTVPVEHVDLARLLAATIAPMTGAGMWVTALSPTGNPPVTHYFSAGYVRPEFAALLPLDGQGGKPATLVSLCAAADPPVSVDLADVTALLTAADVTTQTPVEACARLGLKLISPTYST